MTVLVTGATGFVGSAVAQQLVARGETVRVLVRAGSDRRNIADLPVEPVEGDLRDGASLQRALRGCRALYHVAADYRIWIPRPEEIYETNVAGSVRLLRAAAAEGVERIVYTSSVAVLGVLPDGNPADEETPVRLADMIGHYKRSKFLAEEAVRGLIHDEGLPVVIVNPSTPIGPRDVKPTPTGRLIVEAATGRMPAFVDTGLNVVHVDDVATGHVLAYERGVVGERYVLGGENLTLRQILTEIARLCGRRPPRVRLPHGLVMPLAFAAEAVSRVTGREPFVTVDGLRMARKKMFFSSAKAEATLGYRARPARAALADAVTWFQEAGYLSKN
jgi:dihydroflavonol-4-reductase